MEGGAVGSFRFAQDWLLELWKRGFHVVKGGFRKEKNMRIDPKVALLAYDPGNPSRNIEIRGTVVEMTENGAMRHLDELTQLYLKKADAKFFGDCVPADLRIEWLSKLSPIKYHLMQFLDIRKKHPNPAYPWAKTKSGATVARHCRHASQ